MSKGKKICIWIASILAVLMIGVCMWWLMVYLYAPDKFVSNTYNIGTITTADGLTTKNIVEVSYYSNQNKNGLEKLDIRWNYYQDEDRDLIYSQGLQYVANSKNAKIGFEYKVDESIEAKYIGGQASWLQIVKEYQYVGSYRLDDTQAGRYNYASNDDYTTTFNATNPLSANSMLKIQIGDDIYAMKFKGLNTERDSDTLMYKERVDKSWILSDMNYYYTYYDFDFFSSIIYNALQTQEFGVNKTILFEFGDMFDYYKYDGQSYSEQALTGDARGKVIEEVKTYYSIKVNVSADGAQTAENDSIFKCIHGNSNFNINPNTVTDGYYIGRSIIDVKLGNFDLVLVYGDYVALKLNDNSYNDFIKYKNDIVLDVLIDIDQLKALGYQYFGLADDSRLTEFNIYQIYTQETINGELVKQEVMLW